MKIELAEEPSKQQHASSPPAASRRKPQEPVAAAVPPAQRVPRLAIPPTSPVSAPAPSAQHVRGASSARAAAASPPTRPVVAPGAPASVAPLTAAAVLAARRRSARSSGSSEGSTDEPHEQTAAFSNLMSRVREGSIETNAAQRQLQDHIEMLRREEERLTNVLQQFKSQREALSARRDSNSSKQSDRPNTRRVQSSQPAPTAAAPVDPRAAFANKRSKSEGERLISSDTINEEEEKTHERAHWLDSKLKELDELYEEHSSLPVTRVHSESGSSIGSGRGRPRSASAKERPPPLPVFQPDEEAAPAPAAPAPAPAGAVSPSARGRPVSGIPIAVSRLAVPTGGAGAGSNGPTSSRSATGPFAPTSHSSGRAQAQQPMNMRRSEPSSPQSVDESQPQYRAPHNGHRQYPNRHVSEPTTPEGHRVGNSNGRSSGGAGAGGSSANAPALLRPPSGQKPRTSSEPTTPEPRQQPPSPALSARLPPRANSGSGARPPSAQSGVSRSAPTTMSPSQAQNPGGVTFDARVKGGGSSSQAFVQQRAQYVTPHASDIHRVLEAVSEPVLFDERSSNARPSSDKFIQFRAQHITPFAGELRQALEAAINDPNVAAVAFDVQQRSARSAPSAEFVQKREQRATPHVADFQQAMQQQKPAQGQRRGASMPSSPVTFDAPANKRGSGSSPGFQSHRSAHQTPHPREFQQAMEDGGDGGGGGGEEMEQPGGVTFHSDADKPTRSSANFLLAREQRSTPHPADILRAIADSLEQGEAEGHTTSGRVGFDPGALGGGSSSAAFRVARELRATPHATDFQRALDNGPGHLVEFDTEGEDRQTTADFRVQRDRKTTPHPSQMRAALEQGYSQGDTSSDVGTQRTSSAARLQVPGQTRGSSSANGSPRRYQVSPPSLSGVAVSDKGSTTDGPTSRGDRPAPLIGPNLRTLRTLADSKIFSYSSFASAYEKSPPVSPTSRRDGGGRSEAVKSSPSSPVSPSGNRQLRNSISANSISKRSSGSVKDKDKDVGSPKRWRW